MHQGDKYSLPIVLKQGDTTITSAMVTGVKIKLDTTEYVYPSGTLTYNTGKWYIPLTQAQTLAYSNYAKIQAQINFTTGDIFATDTQNINVENSIIKDVWS